jgi:trehalose synthase
VTVNTPIEIELAPIDPVRLEPIIGRARMEQFLSAAASVVRLLDGRAVVNVNSTSAGGGVAEMLKPLLGYARALGIETRWLVIRGDASFYAVTKRIHNGLYGAPGDGGELGARERAAYERPLGENAESIARRVGSRDVLVLHDPQTAGLIPHLKPRVGQVVWRCHVGLDRSSVWADRAWDFLRPYVEQADAFIFSRREFAPDWIDPRRLAVVPPSIDPFTPKNEELPGDLVLAMLEASGVLASDGSRPLPGGLVVEHVELTRDGVVPDAAAPLVVQISRWDRMKDMTGVMLAFTEFVDTALGAHLILAGPSVDGVSDDPEGAQVLAEVQAQWELLRPEHRSRVHLACIGMRDLAANARVVNALQRQATVVVQKSLAEGFGLTVAEALWKGRPVVASAVGGIVDQITDGEEGLLVEPLDLAAAGAAIGTLVADEALGRRMGENGRRRVVDQFLADRHLEQYAALLGHLLEGEG